MFLASDRPKRLIILYLSVHSNKIIWASSDHPGIKLFYFVNRTGWNVEIAGNIICRKICNIYDFCFQKSIEIIGQLFDDTFYTTFSHKVFA